jgi:beta-phosphoglucomutase-like phosphatase (HAD superfamily)
MILPRKAHAVVFDMDGLILDTEPIYRDAMTSVARDCGLDMPLELYLTTIGLSGEATRALLSERFGKAFDFDVFWNRASKQFYEMAVLQLRLKAGVVELLDVLDDELGLPEPSPIHRAMKTCATTSLPMACSTDFKLSWRRATTCVENQILTRF